MHSSNETELDAEGKLILQDQLERADYDPWGKPVVSKEYAQEMIDKVAILKNQKSLGGNRAKVVGITNSPDYQASTTLANGHIYLSKHQNSDTFKSNMAMGVRLFHELKHIVYY